MKFNSDLFYWLAELTDKYELNEEDLEYITTVFMKASDTNLNRNQVYNKLAKCEELTNPKFIEELFSRFDELVRNAYNI